VLLALRFLPAKCPQQRQRRRNEQVLRCGVQRTFNKTGDRVLGLSDLLTDRLDSRLHVARVGADGFECHLAYVERELDFRPWPDVTGKERDDAGDDEISSGNRSGCPHRSPRFAGGR
jgi:hypothetical protein